MKSFYQHVLTMIDTMVRGFWCQWTAWTRFPTDAGLRLRGGTVKRSLVEWADEGLHRHSIPKDLVTVLADDFEATSQPARIDSATAWL